MAAYLLAGMCLCASPDNGTSFPRVWETVMDMSDRIFIASLMTLALFVLVLERRSRTASPQIMPPAPGDWLLRDTNVPQHRGREVIVDDVGYIDVDDAADAGNE